MILAGMDIATKSGLAILDGERLIHVEAFRPKGEDDAQIFHGFRAHLRPLLVSFGVEYLAYEEPLRSDLKRKDERGNEVAISNMSTFLRLYGLRAHCIEICESLNIPHIAVNQSSWRKSFLGNGRADKDAAVAQCKLLRWPVPNKDSAEACGVAWWLGGHLRVNRCNRPGELFAHSTAA